VLWARSAPLKVPLETASSIKKTAQSLASSKFSSAPNPSNEIVVKREANEAAYKDVACRLTSLRVVVCDKGEPVGAAVALSQLKWALGMPKRRQRKCTEIAHNSMSA
jgi:hypothetical protein